MGLPRWLLLFALGACSCTQASPAQGRDGEVEPEDPSNDAGLSDGSGANDVGLSARDAFEGVSDASEPSSDGGGPSGDCAMRTGGAFIAFRIADETLTVWSTAGAFIDASIESLAGGDPRVPVFARIVGGADCDQTHAWHLDPAMMSYADVTIELCDGRPSDLDGALEYWMNTVRVYCPWSARVTAVDDRR